MTNVTQCIQELAEIFGLQDFQMDNTASVSFLIGEDTLMLDNIDSINGPVCVSVLRPCLSFDTSLTEKALRQCDMRTFPYPIRAGLLHDTNILFTLALPSRQCTAQMVLKIFEHMKTLHQAL